MMGEWMMNGPLSEPIKCVEDMAGHFQAELLHLLPAWKEKFKADPESLPALEHEVHQAFGRGADFIITGLLAMMMAVPEFEASCEVSRRSYDARLAKGRMRTIQIQLLGGLIVWVRTLYCPPKQGWFRSTQQSEVPGIYVGLAQLGFAKGCSPAFEEKVARRAATTHSLAMTQSELAREGIKIDFKTVRRIAYQNGEKLLTLRKRELLAWRAGKLVATNEMAGKRISVQIDGGRMKIRQALVEGPYEGFKIRNTQSIGHDAVKAIQANAQLSEDGGRAEKRRKKTFQSDWREPKLVTIFVHDANGRMEKSSQAWIDGTLTGPDALCELVAMHLYRLGAQSAKSVTFVSDGAPWIWDRIDQIISHAGIPKSVDIFKVLDVCHAVHHVSLAISTLGYDEETRKGLYRGYRKQLRDGEWSQVVAGLRQRMETATNEVDREIMERELSYLTRHGEAGQLSYPAFKIGGLPIGSGAIESSIRRVINLRLKSNAMFWKAENAESMLQLRCQIISGRWDERLKSMRQSMLRNASTDWTWTPVCMRNEIETESTMPA